MKDRLFLFPTALPRDPAIEDWMRDHSGPLGAIAQHWFEVLRSCGDDGRELLHDGHPTACVGDAAFAYVDAFTAHVNLGFFHGAGLPDPHHLLEGAGKHMRHVKLRPSSDSNTAVAPTNLIASSFNKMRRRLNQE